MGKPTAAAGVKKKEIKKEKEKMMMAAETCVRSLGAVPSFPLCVSSSPILLLSALCSYCRMFDCSLERANGIRKLRERSIWEKQWSSKGQSQDDNFAGNNSSQSVPGSGALRTGNPSPSPKKKKKKKNKKKERKGIYC